MGVGRRLKAILRSKGMTIKELSEKSGISLNTLYSITKRDSQRVDNWVVGRIAHTLDVKPSEILFDPISVDLEKIKLAAAIQETSKAIGNSEIESKKILEMVDEILADPAETDDYMERLIFAFNSLNETGQQELVDYAENLTYVPKYKKRDPASDEEVG